jgi:putative RNA 2'-phosphotransferase
MFQKKRSESKKILTMTEKEKKHKSKFLSFVLRHHPELIGLALDENGWADVATLLQAATTKDVHITLDELDEIVATNDKKRFIFNADKSRIRANQGHSINVDLALEPMQPPNILYHGTVDKFMDSIRALGLQKMERHHVHLSSNLATAQQVGSRRGKPVVLTVQAGLMYADGHVFYQSENQVWLTDAVPPKYLEQ